MTEDTLYPHSDEAGRVPGAMRDPFDLIAKAQPGETYHSTESARKEERQRLVWEAMIAYINQGCHDRALEKAFTAVDNYLTWRERDDHR